MSTQSPIPSYTLLRSIADRLGRPIDAFDTDHPDSIEGELVELIGLFRQLERPEERQHVLSVVRALSLRHRTKVAGRSEG